MSTNPDDADVIVLHLVERIRALTAENLELQRTHAERYDALLDDILLERARHRDAIGALNAEWKVKFEDERALRLENRGETQRPRGSDHGAATAITLPSLADAFPDPLPETEGHDEDLSSIRPMRRMSAAYRSPDAYTLSSSPPRAPMEPWRFDDLRTQLPSDVHAGPSAPNEDGIHPSSKRRVSFEEEDEEMEVGDERERHRMTSPAGKKKKIE